MEPKNRDSIRFAVLATDIICFRIISGQLSVLIGEVVSNPFFKGRWALIGGIIKPDETADEASSRLLWEKAGIKEVYKEQLFTFSRVDRDPRGRVVAVAYLALTEGDPQNREEAGIKTKWVPVNDLSGLAYDHDEMLGYALERLRSKIRYTNVAQFLLPEEFTLSELQKAYEIVLGQTLDKRNFRKKILMAKILKDTKHTRKQGVMRPASLYRFISKQPKIVELV